MTFAHEIQSVIQERYLLNHPFYQSWNSGALTRETLAEYTKQYLGHVDSFPRYVSAIHSQCESLEGRQLLLENLIDEERGLENHPELWRRFAEAFGVTREEMNTVEATPASQALVETFMSLCRSSYAEGLAALYAYESQVPEIAQVKIDGLKKFYDVHDERALRFFEVHKAADIYHREAIEKLLNDLSLEEKEKARAATQRATEALWNFLSGIQAHACAA